MFLGRVLRIRHFIEGHIIVLIQFKERIHHIFRCVEGRVFWIEKEDLKNYVLAEGFEGMFEVFENDKLSENYRWFTNGEWNVENK